MSKALNLGATVVPVHTIRSIKAVTDSEREKMAERYGKPVSEFAGKRISIQFADKTTRTSELTLDQVRAQGIGLVNIGADKFVPAANIKSAEPFTEDEAAKLKADGRVTLSQTFRSRVETTAGTILSSATPQQVIERASAAMMSAGQGGKGPNAAIA